MPLSRDKRYISGVLKHARDSARNEEDFHSLSRNSPKLEGGLLLTENRLSGIIRMYNVILTRFRADFSVRRRDTGGGR